MAYKPSPRPSFSRPTHLRFDDVTRYVWGDDQAGEVADWIYVSTDKIHHLVWELPVGGAFRHSAEFRTIFGADVIYYVLDGTMQIANPETGEVYRVRTGEAAFFRKDTWHHAFSVGDRPLRALEYFSPPPSQGTSGAYARTKPLLTTSKYCVDAAVGRWPMERRKIERLATIHVLRADDRLWRIEGGLGSELPVGILVSTEHLTVGQVELKPGQRSDELVRGGDASYYLLEGRLGVSYSTNEGEESARLAPQDGFYLPAGTPHRLENVGSSLATVMFGAAPTDMPGKTSGTGQKASECVEGGPPPEA
jgi:mannose-6-phosphate isomerase-like protein (cupin superfamily)